MSSKTWEDIWRISFIIMTVWAINGIVILFLLARIDSMINVQFYDYGLQFSSDWANPYWDSMNLLKIFIGLPMALSILVFALGLLKYKNRALAIFSKKKSEPATILATEEAPVDAEEDEKPVTIEKTIIPEDSIIPVEVDTESEVNPEPAIEMQPEVIQVVQPEEIVTEQNGVEVAENDDYIEPEMSENKVREDVGLVISCPNCGKVFNRPLIILDFNSGKARLVNVCPYCSHILTETEDSEKQDTGSES